MEDALVGATVPHFTVTSMAGGHLSTIRRHRGSRDRRLGCSRRPWSVAMPQATLLWFSVTNSLVDGRLDRNVSGAGQALC